LATGLSGAAETASLWYSGGEILDGLSRNKPGSITQVAHLAPGTNAASSGGVPYGKLPAGATDIQLDLNGNWVRYRTADGVERVRFKPIEAFTESPPRKHRLSEERRAGLTTDSKVEVLEGRNRAVGAAQGDTIPEQLGGVPDAPDWLDYLYIPLGGQASPSSALLPIQGMPKAT
jgi:hypothetical protein